MTREKLHILQHALGVDAYGRGQQYRSTCVTGPGCADFRLCQELVESGHMIDRGPQALFGGGHVFQVTVRGRLAVAEESPKPPPLSRSQQRYKNYLAGPGPFTFGEWLKRKLYKREMWQ